MIRLSRNDVRPFVNAFLVLFLPLSHLVAKNHLFVDLTTFLSIAVALGAGLCLFSALVFFLTKNTARAQTIVMSAALSWFLLSVVFDYSAASAIMLMIAGVMPWPLPARFLILAGISFYLFSAVMWLMLKIVGRDTFWRSETQNIFLVFCLVLLFMQMPGVMPVLTSFRVPQPYTDVEQFYKSESPAQKPHIIYMMPDRYPSNDNLRQFFDFDNSEFANALRDRGFYVWDRQFANYPRTFVSWASTSNMNYLDATAQEMGENLDSHVPVYRLMQNNQAVRMLKAQGYHYIHMGNWWEPTRTNKLADENIVMGGTFGEFLSVYISQTPLFFLNLPFGERLENKKACALYQKEKEALIDAVRRPDPAFVFWHIFTVHPHYIYDEQGNCLLLSIGRLKNEKNLKNVFTYHVKIQNREFLDVIDRLRVASSRPLVIVIQSDEGPFSWNMLMHRKNVDFWNAPSSEKSMKQGMFNAMLLPSRDYTDFERRQSPVNNFRMIMNEIYGPDVNLLDDRIYLIQSEEHPMKLKDISKDILPGPR